MRLIAVMITLLFVLTTSWAQRNGTTSRRKSKPMQTESETRAMVPALEKYAQGPLSELWKRPGLSPRDRSIITVAALIGRNETIELACYFNMALDNGVKPREISEIITHLEKVNATDAPSEASRRTMPAPMPFEPPVTRATLPVNDFSCTAAMNILQSSPTPILDDSVQNKIRRLFS